jgi:hypothetical protein
MSLDDSVEIPFSDFLLDLSEEEPASKVGDNSIWKRVVYSIIRFQLECYAFPTGNNAGGTPT